MPEEITFEKAVLRRFKAKEELTIDAERNSGHAGSFFEEGEILTEMFPGSGMLQPDDVNSPIGLDIKVFERQGVFDKYFEELSPIEFVGSRHFRAARPGMLSDFDAFIELIDRYESVFVETEIKAALALIKKGLQRLADEE